MNIYAIDLTETEISFIRHSLELVTITGKDAKFLANLQIKLENELSEIQQLKAAEDQLKKQELNKILEHEDAKTKKQKI